MIQVMKHSISLFLFCTLFQSAIAQKRDTRLAGLDTMITRILKEWNVPGVSVSIVEKNKVILAKGFGYKDYDNKKPVTENTQFAIGSCTKAFTASLVGNTIKEKGIDLDVPVSTYFPELKFFDNTLTATVTLRDMLCHRTGVPRHDYSWYSGAATTRENLVHNIRFLEASAPLRQNFQYNNYMYMAIGNLLEKQYGKSWEELIQEKLFSKLSMKNSTTGDINKDGDFSYGYVYKNDKIQKVDFLTTAMKGVAPCGGIVSTAKDMANWLLMWTNQGKFEGEEIISSNFYQQAISSQMIASANLPSKKMTDNYFFNYGLGWYVTSYRGHYGVAHGGNINGFSSFASFMPTDSIGIYVSANQNNSAVPRILISFIIDRMLGADFRDWNTILKQPAVSKETSAKTNNETTKPSHPLINFNGTYKNDGYGGITIKADKDVLTGTFNRWKLKIKHLNYNHFTFSIDADVFDGSEAMNGEFKVAADGTITSLQLPFEDGIADIEFKKELVVIAVAKDDLKKYEGEYEFSGLVFKVYINEAGVLKAIVPGQPEYEMEPVQVNTFNLKGLTGFSAKFEVDDKGNVIACNLTQPNGTFKLKKVVKDNKPAAAQNSNSNTQVKNAGITQYAGEYNMGGQTVKVFVDGDKLKASLPGQPVYELVNIKNDEFSIKGVKGYGVTFEKNEKGEVIGFTMKQPNGSIKGERKN
jgi:CubicO group peptidase (beta-lactamase class C family)